MGMFDDITYTAPCPICGTPLTNWQSKSGGCVLQKITPAELWDSAADPYYDDNPVRDQYGVDFYKNCENCATWVEINIRPGHTSHADGNRRGPILPGTNPVEGDA